MPLGKPTRGQRRKEKVEFWANSLLKPPWCLKILRRAMLKILYSEYKSCNLSVGKYDFINIMSGRAMLHKTMCWSCNLCFLSGIVRWTTTKQLSVFCNESSGILAPKPRIISQRAHLLHCWCQKITPSWPNGNLLCQRDAYLLTIQTFLLHLNLRPKLSQRL